MKTFLLLTFLFLSLGTYAQDTLEVAPNDTTVAIDTFVYNRVILDTNIEKAILIGLCTEDGLRTSPIFSNYYEKEYNNYEPDLEFLETLTLTLSKVNIVVILGSWCSDSQREVPRLMRVLDELNFSLDSLQIIAVDRMKTVPDVDISRYMIEFVPTIIFYVDDFEIGRIVEAPVETIEDDMASFFMKVF